MKKWETNKTECVCGGVGWGGGAEQVRASRTNKDKQDQYRCRRDGHKDKKRRQREMEGRSGKEETAGRGLTCNTNCVTPTVDLVGTY